MSFKPEILLQRWHENGQKSFKTTVRKQDEAYGKVNTAGVVFKDMIKEKIRERKKEAGFQSLDC